MEVITKIINQSINKYKKNDVWQNLRNKSSFPVPDGPVIPDKL